MADGMAALAPDLIPALVDARGWMSNKMFTNGLRFFALPAVRRQLEAEIRAQFASFARTGLALDHVNAHKHFHLHPSLLAMMVRIGVEYGVSAVRVPAEPIWFAARGGSRLAAASSAVLLRPWIEWMRRRLRAAGLRSSDRVFGIGCSGNMDEQALLEVLGRLPPGVSEIYLHPATESGSAIASSMAAYRHADELAALLSPRVRAAVVATGARLGGYREIL
jgi:hopanoid biosynthesis associated protein HpnK